MMPFDLSVLLQVGQIIAILAGGGLVAFRLGRTTARVEATLSLQNRILETQSAEISELKNETKKLGDVLTAIAVQGTRLDRLETDLQDLRHGRGFIASSINREYGGRS
jgi:hypothetical protein